MPLPRSIRRAAPRAASHARPESGRPALPFPRSGGEENSTVGAARRSRDAPAGGRRVHRWPTTEGEIGGDASTERPEGVARVTGEGEDDARGVGALAEHGAPVDGRVDAGPAAQEAQVSESRDHVLRERDVADEAR